MSNATEFAKCRQIQADMSLKIDAISKVLLGNGSGRSIVAKVNANSLFLKILGVFLGLTYPVLLGMLAHLLGVMK